jgi:C4-dicarboxylate-specific signal transduction histidine kinase
LILFNLMAAQQMGGTPAVFAGRYVQDLYGPQMGAVIMTRIGAVIHSETCLEYEDLVALPTGAKWYHSIYSRVRNSQGVVEGVQIISIDITPRKEAEEKAVVQQNAIAHLSRVVTMGELAAGIAHEVNQPLGASLLYAETCRDLLQSGATDAVKLLPALHSLIGQLERARATVTRLKKFIRRQSLTYSTMDVNQVLTESADFLARQIKHARATLIFELAPRPPLVIADTILIQQVVINLIMNALEAMAAAGARIRRLTLGTATAANGACTITVRDTGPGVPAALVGRFFDSFVSGKPQGMGLGLAISRSIVEQLEGRIWYEPAKEGGALFSFTIPAAPSTKKGVSS